MRKITFATLAMMMGGLSCGGPAVEETTAGPATEGTNAVDDELAPNGRNAIPRAVQVNLVSDEKDKRDTARMIDPNLKNAWGLAFNPAGFAWVSAAETGLSPVYDAKGNLRLTVTIPVPEGIEGSASPTGQVFNGQSEDFKGDAFIFVTEQGTIAGWQPSNETMAVLRVDNSKEHAIYKGVTIAKSRKGDGR